MGWRDIPSAKDTEIPKVLHLEHVDNFFNSQGIIHKEYVPKGKTVNAEFYKGVMDRLLKHNSMGSASCVLLSRLFLVAW